MTNLLMIINIFIDSCQCDSEHVVLISFKKVTMRFLVFILALYLPITNNAQIIEPAPPDKAVVYFSAPYLSTPGLLGMYQLYSIFKPDGKSIGIVTWRNYIRHECDPGTNYFVTFSSAFKNYSVVKSDLAAGRIYVILVQRIDTPISSFIELHPINPVRDLDNLKSFQKVLSRDFSENKIERKTKRQEQFLEYLNKAKRVEKNKQHINKKIGKMLREGKYKKLYANWYIEPIDLIRSTESDVMDSIQ